MIPVIPQDMCLMIICTVRYALGRSSYIVPDVCEMVIRYRDYLTPLQLVQVVNEVTAALDKSECVGMRQDHETWRRLVASLEL